MPQQLLANVIQCLFYVLNQTYNILTKINRDSFCLVWVWPNNTILSILGHDFSIVLSINATNETEQCSRFLFTCLIVMFIV